MSKTYYNPLSDMGKIKETLVNLFQSSPDITKLATHCFDTPYIEGIITDNGCSIFLETRLIKVANQRIKEVGVDIYVICHKNSIALTEEDQAYYNSIDIYGNRMDCTIQAIHSAITNAQNMDAPKKSYAIGDMTLVAERPIKQHISEKDFYGKKMSYTYQAFYQKK